MTRAENVVLLNNDRFDKTLNYIFRILGSWISPISSPISMSIYSLIPMILAIIPSVESFSKCTCYCSNVMTAESGARKSDISSKICWTFSRSWSLSSENGNGLGQKYGCDGRSWETAGLPYLRIVIMTLYHLITESPNAWNLSRCPQAG